jgi:GDP-D-mannose dehydratase
VEVDPARVRGGDAELLAGDPAALRALGWRAELPIERTLAALLEAEERAVAALAGAAP